MAEARTKERKARVEAPNPAFDWREIARLVMVSRALDRLEETELVPARKILYQFSARGHDLAQVMLGSLLDRPRDSACGYYRSRPMLLALGVPLADALGSNMGRAGGYSDGRDIGVVFNYPNPERLPGAADVRRSRRPIYADRRLGAGDRLSPQGAGATIARTARSPSCSAATPRAPPTASGRR